MRTSFRLISLFLNFSLAGAAMAGCGGLAPAGPNGPGASAAAHRAASAALVYVGGKEVVDVFGFPGGSAQGSFNTVGAIRGMCSDANGNVYIATAPATKSGLGHIYKYAHGGTTPIATLDAPKRVVPIACSSDPTTGNLAVSEQNEHNFTPTVAIYANASGSPAILTSPDIGADPQLAYDNAGNLFATSGGNVGAELAQGASGLSKITLTKTFGGVSHVQWDGTAFALQSFGTLKHNGEKLFERIYRVTISGSTGKLSGTTKFLGWPEKNAGQSWIDGGTIVATPYSEMVFWNYPAGGKAILSVHTPNGGKAITVSD
ncbi:MAG TPA: hypothetical protein VEW74_09910 [Candidatus Nitrosotalea sp.]|nr:hypothetical protein [Candidatus Nitrosotalea sp.]